MASNYLNTAIIIIIKISIIYLMTGGRRLGGRVGGGANKVCVTQLKNGKKQEKYSHLQMYFAQNGVQNPEHKAVPEKCTCIENKYVLPSNQQIYTTLSQNQ
jgi:hypothetical protein